MELKKLILPLIAAFTVTASAVTFAALPTNDSADALIEKVTAPTVDGDTTLQWRKCPPFCI